MPLLERLQLYRELENERKRPLIVYVTSSRPNANGRMAADVIPEFLDQINCVPSTERAVDLLVASQGGDATVAWRVMCLLRERFSEVAVLVPQSAFSAATLLCLGADEIVMHAHGNLGPVDPQITVKRKSKNDDVVEVKYGYEEVISFIQFVRERAHITDQRELSSILAKLLDDIGTVSVGTAVRGSMLSQHLGENLLKMHMTTDAEGVRAKEIAEMLNKKYFHHGYAVGRKEASAIGLKIKAESEKVESLLWKIWEDLEADMVMRVPFNPMAELAKSPATAPLFAPLTTITMPQGIPPQLAQQMLNQIMGQVQISVSPVPALDVETVHGVTESRRLCSRFCVRRKFFGSRQFDGAIAVSGVDLFQGWERVQIPAIPEPQPQPEVNSQPANVDGKKEEKPPEKGRRTRKTPSVEG